MANHGQFCKWIKNDKEKNPQINHVEGTENVKWCVFKVPQYIIDLVNDVIRHRKGSEPTGWQAFAEGLRDMNIPQDVIGNRERWDWMHRAPETPETDYITPKQKRTIRKTASRIPVSVRSAKTLSVRKRIKDHFSSPALLSAIKKRIKEEFSSPWVSYNEA